MAVRCPLRTNTHGAIRLRAPRVPFDTIVAAFPAGAMAEETSGNFPFVALADVY